MNKATPPRKNRYSLPALKRKVEIEGLDCVNRRTQAGRLLFEWRSELLTALGGEENVSPQRKTLVDVIVRTRIYLDHIDAYLMSMPSLIIKRRRAIMPALIQRTTLVESLARLLRDLGLDRQAKKVEDLDAFIERRGKEMEEAQNEKPDNH